jgi:site-specific recombinase XerD
MNVFFNSQAPLGTSLASLIKGFVLTKQTEGKSNRTVEFYSENLRRFIWYAQKHEFPDDIRFLTEWHFREFLAYVGNDQKRWGLEGNGSETSRYPASHTTIHHYFVALSTFLNWAFSEGFIKENPIKKIKVARPKPKVIVPYSSDEIQKILKVCDYDFEHNAKFLGSRNRSMILMLLDAGLRLSELTSIRLSDIDNEKGYIKITGKGDKQRVVRIGKATRKSLWRYLVFRKSSDTDTLWLTEEGKPINKSSVQSLIKRLKQRAGVTSTGTTHRFRHTFALNFLRADRNVFNLQYLLGHSDLDMVRRYTATMGMEDALKAHEKSSPADLMGLE